jgi:hypothetical protein
VHISARYGFIATSMMGISPSRLTAAKCAEREVVTELDQVMAARLDAFAEVD